MQIESQKYSIAILLCLWILPIVVDSASAHRVNVFAWVDGDTIHVESKFAGGKKVKAGKVVVVDPQGVELLAGLTNDQGEYSFQVPKQSDLRIILIAGQGHQGEWTVRETELQGPSPATKTETATLKTVTSEQKNIVDKPSVDSEAAISGNMIKPQELEAIIEKVLDRKLRPVTKMLADMRQKEPGARDIFAGIGYIIGLVGIAAYVQNRKKKA